MIKKWLAKLCAWYLGKYSPIIDIVRNEPNSEIVPPEFKITR